MRLGINASIITRKPSGLGVYAENIIKQLARYGKDDRIIIYTSFPGRLNVPSNAEIRYIPESVQPLSMKGHINRFAWSQVSLPGLLRRDRIDLLLNAYVDGPIFSLVPQIITMHDLLPLVFPREYPRQRFYFNTCVRALASKAKRVLTCSENTRDDIIRRFGLPADKIKVIPLGFDAAHYYPRGASAYISGLTGGLPYILYVGNLLPHKNVSGLIKAFAGISKNFPHCLVIAGNKDPRYYPALQSLAGELGVAGRVLFLDYFTYAQMPELFSSCSVFVFASLYEGFGLPLLEAMACGVPVVTSDSSSMPEVCADSAVYVNPCYPESIGAGIQKVLFDNLLRAALVAKGRERVKMFSWESTGMKTYTVLREAFAG